MINMPDIILFSLILMRMSGFILLNPVLGRRNIPTMARAGLIMVLAVFMYFLSPSRGMVPDINNTFEYGLLLLKEFAIGYALGFIMELFFYIVTYAGGIMDFNMGMSMANIYDPQTNINMPLSGSLLQAMMMLLFFTADGHLVVIRIFLESEKALPYTEAFLSTRAIAAVLDIFKECTVLAVKLSFPIMAFELLGEVGVGVLMKVIPQINVFVVNIQAKVLIGNLLLLLLCMPIGLFVSDIIDMMIRSVQQFLLLL